MVNKFAKGVGFTIWDLRFGIYDIRFVGLGGTGLARNRSHWIASFLAMTGGEL